MDGGREGCRDGWFFGGSGFVSGWIAGYVAGSKVAVLAIYIIVIVFTDFNTFLQIFFFLFFSAQDVLRPTSVRARMAAINARVLTSCASTLWADTYATAATRVKKGGGCYRAVGLSGCGESQATRSLKDWFFYAFLNPNPSVPAQVFARMLPANALTPTSVPPEVCACMNAYLPCPSVCRFGGFDLHGHNTLVVSQPTTRPTR